MFGKSAQQASPMSPERGRDAIISHGSLPSDLKKKRRFPPIKPSTVIPVKKVSSIPNFPDIFDDIESASLLESQEEEALSATLKIKPKPKASLFWISGTDAEIKTPDAKSGYYHTPSSDDSFLSDNKPLSIFITEKFQKDLGKFELRESNVRNIELFIVCVSTIVSFYSLIKNYFFASDDDDDAAQPVWFQGSNLFLNVTPLLLSLFVRNYMLSQSMRIMSSLLRDCKTHEMGKSSLVIYMNKVRAAVQEIVAELQLLSTKALESRFIKSLFDKFLSEEEIRVLCDFMKSFEESFHISDVDSFWRYGYLFCEFLFFTALIAATILFSNLIGIAKEWQDLVQFILSLSFVFISCASTVLDNSTLFILKRYHENLKKEVNLVKETEKTIKKLEISFDRQLSAHRELGSDISSAPEFSLSDEPDVDSIELLVRPASEKLELLFFVDSVRKEGARQKIFEQYDEVRKQAEEVLFKLIAFLHKHSATIKLIKLPDYLAREDIDYIVEQSHLAISSHIDLEKLSQKIDLLSIFLSSIKTNAQINTFMMKFDLFELVNQINTLQKYKNEYNHSPQGIVKLRY